MERFYFQKPTGLLFKGSVCKTMKLSLSKHRDGRKQIWFATNTGCTWGSAAALHRANVRRETHKPSNCCQSCVTPALHNYVERADVPFSRIIFFSHHDLKYLYIFSVILIDIVRSSELHKCWDLQWVELPLSCVIRAAIQIPKLWHHVNSQYQYFHCRGWLL